MKKIILFVSAVVLTMSINACSSSDDDGGTSGKVTATINGVAKTFNVVVVNKDTYTEGGVSYTDLTVTASVGNSSTEFVTFDLSQEDLGADAIYNFSYVDGTNSFLDGSDFNSIVQTNTANGKLKGTFSGTLNRIGSAGEDAVITNGTFDINY